MSMRPLVQESAAQLSSNKLGFLPTPSRAQYDASHAIAGTSGEQQQADRAPCTAWDVLTAGGLGRVRQLPAGQAGSDLRTKLDFRNFRLSPLSHDVYCKLLSMLLFLESWSVSQQFAGQPTCADLLLPIQHSCLVHCSAVILLWLGKHCVCMSRLMQTCMLWPHA